MCTDKVGAMPQRFPGQAHRFFVIAPDELRIGGNTAIDRGERIAWAEPERMPRGTVTLFPSPAIGQRDPVISPGRGEVGVQSERELKFGERILEPTIEQVDAGKGVVG